MRRKYMMNVTNEMELIFDSIPENEGFARVAVGSFFAQLNPTLEEVCDIKTAVCEAVTNSIIHGYGEAVAKIWVKCQIDKKANLIVVEVVDKGCGIVDIEKAIEPLYTTKSELERAGMGFAFMEAFMDKLEVESTLGEGTKIRMEKEIGRVEWLDA